MLKSLVFVLVSLFSGVLFTVYAFAATDFSRANPVRDGGVLWVWLTGCSLLFLGAAVLSWVTEGKNQDLVNARR